MAKFLGNLDYVFNAYFIVEMLIKIITLGFITTKRAYLKDAWNVLDFVIVNLAVVSMIISWSTGGGGGLRSLRALRALRALRPLRMIQRAPNLKLVVNALIAVVPDVVNVLLIC